LAFEEDDQWVPRLQEFNDCTGATVRLTYLPEGEDGMEDAIRRDVGDDILPGEGIFDAYIVQAPWYVLPVKKLIDCCGWYNMLAVVLFVVPRKH
jgi:hypothetical protein